ncbi:hypothetical protein JCM1840_000614 [Sporobolomyces johnsonii]
MDHPAATLAPPSDAPALLEPPTPRTSVGTLPFDVVDLILDECLDEDEPDRWDCAKALSLSSRGLRERAQQVLWKEIELPGTSRSWDSGRLRAICTTPRLADMVTTVWWEDWQGDDPPMPDQVLPRVEQLFRACRNILRIHLGTLEARHLPRIFDAIRASESRLTLNRIAIWSPPLPADFRLTEANLLLFLQSIPSLTNLTLKIFVGPPSITSSTLLNLRTCLLAPPTPLPSANELYEPLLHSLNRRTLKHFTTWCMLHLDWLCSPGFSLDTITIFTSPSSPALLLPHLTRLFPFHPNLRHLNLHGRTLLHVPCEDSADLTAFRQILSILPPTLYTLELPFAIDLETIPLQQLLTDMVIPPELPLSLIVVARLTARRVKG